MSSTEKTTDPRAKVLAYAISEDVCDDGPPAARLSCLKDETCGCWQFARRYLAIIDSVETVA